MLIDNSRNTKITFVSCIKNFLEQDIFTKYSILIYKGKVLLIFKSKYINSEEIISVNVVEEISMQYEEEDIIISIPNYIEISKDLIGTYTNGFRFLFKNIISIEEEELQENEFTYYLQRGNVNFETKINKSI